jgi:hypothetical protein
MKNLILLLAGVFGGIAFILSCGSDDGVSAGGDAQAQPSGCRAWQVIVERIDSFPPGPSVNVVSGTTESWQLPDGWEPIAMSDSVTVVARRCLP